MSCVGYAPFFMLVLMVAGLTGQEPQQETLDPSTKRVGRAMFDFFGPAEDPTPCEEQSQEAECVLQRAIRSVLDRHKVRVVYDALSSSYKRSHLEPLMRALPGKYVEPGSAEQQFSEPGRETMTCAELHNYIEESPSHIFVSLKGPEHCGCGSPEEKGTQLVRLWHGIDLLGVTNFGQTSINTTEDVFRGDGARNHQTRYPPLVYTRHRSQLVPADFASSHVDTSAKPILLVLMSAEEHNYLPKPCEAEIAALADTYEIQVVVHPAFETSDQKRAGFQLFHVKDVQDRGGIENMVRQAAVVIAEMYDTSTSTLVMGFGKPLILQVDEAVRSWLKKEWPKGSYPDQFLLRPWSAGNDAKEGCKAVKSTVEAARHASSKQVHRQTKLWRRIVGCIDGYEEYRTAFSILRGLATTDDEDMEQMYEAYHHLTSGPANGVLYVDGLCDPSDPVPGALAALAEAKPARIIRKELGK